MGKHVMRYRLFVAVICCFTAIISLSYIRLPAYVFSSEEMAFSPNATEAHEGGIEYYLTDIKGGRYTGKKGSVPVCFCKFGKMIAVNANGCEKPWIWKVDNKVVVFAGDESGSVHLAQSKAQVVVMDADECVMRTALLSTADLMFLNDLRHVEVNESAIVCCNDKGERREILITEMYRGSWLSRLVNRCMISAATWRGKRSEACGLKWTDPDTWLEWDYIEIDGGVEIFNKKTFGCAVAPMPKGRIVFPERIDGKDVISIRSGAMVNCDVESVFIPKTVRMFPDGAWGALSTWKVKTIEVDAENRTFKSIDGLLYNADGTELLRVPCGAVEVRIPDTVVRVADEAFNKCEQLKSVVIPSSVREMGVRVFFMSRVEEVRFMGDAPRLSESQKDEIYSMTPTALKTIAKKDAKGWRLPNGEFPKMWCHRPVVFE